MRRTEVQDKVHVKSCFERFIRFTPFRNDHRLGIFPVQPFTDILPETDRALAVGIVLHKRACHIDTEAVRSHIQPELHDVLQFRLCGHRALIIR